MVAACRWDGTVAQLAAESVDVVVTPEPPQQRRAPLDGTPPTPAKEGQSALCDFVTYQVAMGGRVIQTPPPIFCMEKH